MVTGSTRRHKFYKPDRILNPVYRLALRTIYPLLCHWQKISGRRPRTASVAVWHDGEILVVRHSYRPGLDLPGGDQRRTETATQTAVRELREEVGIEADERALVPVTVTYPRHSRLALFEYRPQIRPETHIDNREIINASFQKPSQLADASQLLRRYVKEAAQSNFQGPFAEQTTGDNP